MTYELDKAMEELDTMGIIGVNVTVQLHPEVNNLLVQISTRYGQPKGEVYRIIVTAAIKDVANRLGITYDPDIKDGRGHNPRDPRRRGRLVK